MVSWCWYHYYQKNTGNYHRQNKQCIVINKAVGSDGILTGILNMCVETLKSYT